MNELFIEIDELTAQLSDAHQKEETFKHTADVQDAALAEAQEKLLQLQVSQHCSQTGQPPNLLCG